MIRLCSLIIITLALAACAGVRVEHTPLPNDLVDVAAVENLEAARTWADAFSQEYLDTLELRERQIRQSGLAKHDVAVLALSGGGQNGAFGAGYLNGWSDRGDRPEFEVVTGVSTGALIAPFAFLGSGYDSELRRFYTSVSTRDIVRYTLISGLLGGAAVTDSQPLADLIAQSVTPEFLSQVAREHARGRRLALITTNLEAQRPVTLTLRSAVKNGEFDPVAALDTENTPGPSVRVPLPTLRQDARLMAQSQLADGFARVRGTSR